MDMTTCKPKYPVFDLSISLSNAYMLNEVEMQSWYKKAEIFAVGSARVPFVGDDHLIMKLLIHWKLMVIITRMSSS